MINNSKNERQGSRAERERMRGRKREKGLIVMLAHVFYRKHDQASVVSAECVVIFVFFESLFFFFGRDE